MKISRKVRWVIILALVALLAIGGAGAVAAAGNQHGPGFRHVARGTFGSAPQHKWRSHEGFGLHSGLLDRQAIAAAVANALNVNPDELQAAIQAGRDSVQELLDAAGLEPTDLKSVVETEVESQLAAAVEAGTLTQEEMDAILSHDHGRKGSWSGRGGRFFDHMWPTDAIDAQAVLQATAAHAGLDADELLTALTEGRSALDTFLEANDTTSAALKAAWDTVRQQAIADAVAEGTLSSEQAERLNQKGGLGDGLDGGGRHGRHRHGWPEYFGGHGPREDNT